MILQNVINDYEAIQYDGNNTEALNKFCRRHGTAIDWHTTPQGDTNGYLQTAGGTIDIVRGIIVACGVDDQMFRVLPKELGNAFPAKFTKVADEGRIGDWIHPQEPEPPVEEPEPAAVAQVDEPLLLDQRLDRLETIVIELAKTLVKS